MKRLLFIEDELALQKTLGDMFRKNGYEVISALNGKAGIELANKEKPDVILLDLILPKMDGFEVLSNLKKTEETKEIPVIILTNLDNISDIDKALELGAKIYLVKANYSQEEVVEKVNQVLSSREKTKE
ncbi:response regulator [bacterium]|nr:response regulator [bacterium]